MTPITTTIPSTLAAEAKRGGITIQSLVIDGWNARKTIPGLMERIRELERRVERLAGELETTQKQLWQYRAPGDLRLKR